RGGAVISCDNSFELYVNGRKVLHAEDWTKPQAVLLHTLLKKGDNQLVVLATNTGNSPNPAGLFFEARLVVDDGGDDGEEIVIASDATWTFNPTEPAGGAEGRLGRIAGKWKQATIVPPLAAWSEVIDANAPAQLTLATSGNM